MAKVLSDYELARLERIKENQEMLKELFPKGTALRSKPSIRVRRRKRSDDVDVDSRESGGSTPDECPSPEKKRCFTVRREVVTPRRNPTRQARPSTPLERRLTRSLTKSIGEELTDGLEDDQEVRRVVYRTYRRCETIDENLPIELDEKPGMSRHQIRTVERSTEKVYDRVNGATCHQCRQKTIDTKTICHNKNCKGTRGQFCGPCLQNRYGEDLFAALANTEWICPPCRKICNCSFCMPKRGKAPTGIMIHIARECGYDNVHEYLDKSNDY